RALLQVLDNGELRLANGQQKISFRNSYVFLTSNLGSAAVAERRRSRVRQLADRVRIDRPHHGHHLVQRALEKFFDPEFFNRIDETVILDEFDEQTAEQVTRLEIELITTRLARRGVDVDVDDSAVALLQRRGFDPVYGARGLRRTIRNVLADPVAAAVLDLRPVGTQPLALQARAVGDQIQVKKVP
ncbi:MAG: ATPase, partial [Rhodococcus erythropolis]|nr:ATPase [Rhodococcus erythropolis]